MYSFQCQLGVLFVNASFLIDRELVQITYFHLRSIYLLLLTHSRIHVLSIFNLFCDGKWPRMECMECVGGMLANVSDLVIDE